MAQPPWGGLTALASRPRDAHLAADKHPETVIPFDADGYADFSGVATRTVKIKQTGKRGVDEAAANKEAGLSSTPKGPIILGITTRMAQPWSSFHGSFMARRAILVA